MNSHNHPVVAVLGTGRVARAIVPGLITAGYRVDAVGARNRASARRFRRRVPGVRVTSRPVDAARHAEVLLLAVPDSQIGPVAETLAGERPRPWVGAVVLHHAGSLGPAPLNPLSAAGAAVGVLHPLQSLGIAGRRNLVGSRVRIEGTPRACSVATRLARDLGMVPLRFRGPIGDAERASYHAAASLASNDLVALLGVALDLMVDAGLDRREALDGLVKLARGTLANIEAGRLEGALTGPVPRGDLTTLTAQLDLLARDSPDVREIHRLLSRRLASQAERAGILETRQRRAMDRVLGGRSPDRGV